MTQKRLEQEKQILERNFSANCFVFKDMETDCPYVLMAVKSNKGKVYTIRIELADFPEKCPNVYVTRMLYDAEGNPMVGTDECPYTYPSKYGYTRIKHYSPDMWTNTVPIYKVYCVASLWINIYERSIDTGRSMKSYLELNEIE